MSNKKKKVYYISEIAKAYDNYSDSYYETIGNVGGTIFFGVLAAVTISLPFLPIFDKNMDVVDQAKSLILGIGVPAITLPMTIKKIKDTIESRREMRKNSKILKEHMGDITAEEIEEYEEYMDNMKKNHMCLELKNK